MWNNVRVPRTIHRLDRAIDVIRRPNKCGSGCSRGLARLIELLIDQSDMCPHDHAVIIGLIDM
jgi:hypothetical protein